MKRILLLPLILIIGCYSPKKAEKQLDKAKDKYPALVAQKTSNWFPCKEVKVVTDSSAYKRWLASLDSLFNRGTDTVVIVDSFETISTDCSKYKENLIAISSLLNKANHTIRLIRNKTINPPAIHDTIIKLDSTQIVILSDKLNTSEKERQEQESKRNFWFKFGISFLVAFLISLIFNILKHIKW
jgi:hypothetical protein